MMYPVEFKFKLREIFFDNERFIEALDSDDINAITYLDIKDFNKDATKIEAYIELLKFSIELLEELAKKEKKLFNKVKKKSIKKEKSDDIEKGSDEDNQELEDSDSKGDSDPDGAFETSENSYDEPKDVEDDANTNDNWFKKLKKMLSSASGGEKEGNKQSGDNLVSIQSQIEGLKELQKLAEVTQSISGDLQKLEEKEYEPIKLDESVKNSSQDWLKHDLVGLGGRELKRSEALKVIRDWIVWISQSGLYSKSRGNLYLDKKKIAKHIVTEQNWKIKDDRMNKAYAKILFMLDFSGSCSWISRTFADLGKFACGFSNVIVAYGGYEGYVQGFIDKDTDIDKISNYFGYYNDNEVSLADYLEKNKGIKSIIILGDYDGTPRYIDAYLKNRDKKFIWFNCDRGRFHGILDSDNLHGLEKHMYKFDGTIEGLARLTKILKKKNI